MLFVFEGEVVVVVPGFKFMFCHANVCFCVVVLGGDCGFVNQVVCQACSGKWAGGILPWRAIVGFENFGIVAFDDAGDVVHATACSCRQWCFC